MPLQANMLVRFVATMLFTVCSQMAVAGVLVRSDWAPPRGPSESGSGTPRGPIAPWVLLCVHVGGQLLFSGPPDTEDCDEVKRISQRMHRSTHASVNTCILDVTLSTHLQSLCMSVGCLPQPPPHTPHAGRSARLCHPHPGARRRLPVAAHGRPQSGVGPCSRHPGAPRFISLSRGAAGDRCRA